MQDIHHYFLSLCAATLCFALLTLAGCGGGDEEAPPAARYQERCRLAQAPDAAPELPAPMGANCVGKQHFLLLDATRPEPFTTDETDHRQLHLKVWYPAQAGGGVRASYMDPLVLPLMKDSMGLPDEAPDVATNALPGAALPPAGRYPVILFSPGHGMIVEAYTSMLEDLASHGYVVVGIDHPYLSGPTSLAGGEIALTQPVEPASIGAYMERAAGTLVADQRQVLDWLAAQDAASSGSLFSGRLDLSRIGAYGHSLGGAISLRTAMADIRVKASIDIDGTMFGDTTGPWTRPLLFVLAADHDTDPSIAAVLVHATGPAGMVELPGARHLDFGDLKYLLDRYAPETTAAEREQMELGSIDAAEAIRFTRERTLAFFEAHVRP